MFKPTALSTATLFWLFNSVLGQQCLTLPNNTVCGSDWSMYSVRGDIFQSVLQFNNSISQNFSNIDAIGQVFVNTFGCSSSQMNSAVHTLRYQVSYWCSNIAVDAITHDCKPQGGSRPPGGPLLCSQQCSAAVNSVSSLLTNTTVCPSVDSASTVGKARANVISKMTSFCSQSLQQINSLNGGQCTQGADSDYSFCGFSSDKDASAYCPALINTDDCCANFIKAKLIMADQKTARPGADVNVGAITGGVIGGLVFLAVVVLFVYRKKRSKDNHWKAFGKSKYPDHQIYNDMSKAGSQNSFAETPKVNTAQTAELSYSEYVSTPVSAGSTVDYMNGTKYRVVYPYNAEMPDELELQMGDEVMVSRQFDDGWAAGLNLRTGLKGALPMVCVETMNQEQRPISSEAPRISKRLTSMTDPNVTAMLEKFKNVASKPRQSQATTIRNSNV